MGVVQLTVPMPLTAPGYWGVGNDGGVFAVGGAGFYGSIPGLGQVVTDVVDIASTPSGTGYWLLRNAGGGAIYAFGDAQAFGNGSLPNAIAGMASHPTTQGYWIVDSAGNVDAFGGAGYFGGGGLSGVVGIISNAAGDGYWIITSGGGVHPYGSAAGISSFGPAFPVVAGYRTPSGQGFICADAIGGAYALGDAQFQNSLPGESVAPAAFVTGCVMFGDGGGYYMTDYNGNVYAFGDANYDGNF